MLISADNFSNDSVKTQLLRHSQQVKKNSYPHQLYYTGMINRKNCIDRWEANVLFDVCPADEKKHQGELGYGAITVNGSIHGYCITHGLSSSVSLLYSESHLPGYSGFFSLTTRCKKYSTPLALWRCHSSIFVSGKLGETRRKSDLYRVSPREKCKELNPFIK